MKKLLLLLSLLLATSGFTEAKGLECKSEVSSIRKINSEEGYDTYWYRIDLDKGICSLSLVINPPIRLIK